MSSEGQSRGGIWRRARALAEATPESRNRYVDFLRALSILAVVTGHWLIAAPHVRDGVPSLGHMLDISPWTRWLTWGFQVMPVFFMVGGYSNAASWTAARRARRTYGEWLGGRLHRLVAPLLPLLAVWAGFALVAGLAGVRPGMIRIGSQAALVPVWFLAVYVVVALCAPVAHAAWRRFGLASFWGLAAAAIFVDLIRFVGGATWVGWTNYLFVWLAVHQLGFAWRDGRLNGAVRCLAWSAVGLTVLIGLVTRGPYPISMVGVPGEEVSNTLPPSLAMLALGMFQGGLLLALESPARRWLSRTTVWTGTVIVNGMIMTVYLWHLTAMVLVIGASVLLGGPGLRLDPGTGTWWATRPLWMLLLLVVLWPAIPLFGRYERTSAPAVPSADWRLVAGAVLVCLGLARCALSGVGGAGALGINLIPLAMVFFGAALTGTLPRLIRPTG